MTTSTPVALDAEIAALATRIAEDKARLADLRRARPAQPVTQDYVFTAPDGTAHPLSSLFGDRDELIVIHNMGTRCTYCMLWADGFNGVLPHLENRAAFVVTSPDVPEVQAKVRAQRGWRFRMVSNHGTTFAEDMGFRGPVDAPDLQDPDGPISDWPGLSTFHKAKDGTITRVARAEFGPGDDYCAVWAMFDLLPKGVDGWQPQYTYQGGHGHAHGAGCCH